MSMHLKKKKKSQISARTVDLALKIESQSINILFILTN